MKKEDALVPAVAAAFAFVMGFFVGFDFVAEKMHTEKHGCEYVEKSPCKQVWIKE